MLLQLSVTVALLTVGVPEREKNGLPHLRSESVIVRLADENVVLIGKNADVVRPIASVTKLMSGLLLGPARTVSHGAVEILDADKDKKKWSKSRLAVGLTFPWELLVRAALGASDNRAMYASVRATGLDQTTFVARMNQRARELGMTRSHFVDPAGIDPGNVSTANDLIKLVAAAADDPSLCSDTLEPTIDLTCSKTGRSITLTNPNRLARSGRWEVVLGKTGYTVEAGRALVTRVVVSGRQVDLIMVGAREMASVFGDAGRIRRWLEEKLEVRATLPLESLPRSASAAASP